MSTTYQLMLKDSKLTLKLYKDERKAFLECTKGEGGQVLNRLIQKQPALMLFMIEQAKSKEDYSELKCMPTIVEMAAWNHEEVAVALFNKTELFDSILSDFQRIKIILKYPELIKRFVHEGGIKNLHCNSELSKLVTSICVTCPGPKDDAICYWDSHYGFKLKKQDRDALCIKIAQMPAQILMLNPAARILLLARLKQIKSHSQKELNLPLPMQVAYQEAYDIPLDWEELEGAFWLPVLGGMNRGNSYFSCFKNLLRSVHSENQYFGDDKDQAVNQLFGKGLRVEHYWVQREHAQAVGLAVLLEPSIMQPQNGYDCHLDQNKRH